MKHLKTMKIFKNLREKKAVTQTIRFVFEKLLKSGVP